MKRLLILGAPIFQIPVVETAKKMGLYVGIVDINREAPAFQYADATYVCSIRDKDAVLAMLEILNQMELYVEHVIHRF